MHRCKQCNKPITRVHKSSEPPKFCSRACTGLSKRSAGLPRTACGKLVQPRGPADEQHRFGMTRSEVAEQLTREWKRPVSTDEVAVIELRALRKLATAARASAAIRELLCLAS